MKTKLAKFFLNFSSEKGFTLIEVIVIVTVIAILAAISVNTFGNYSRSQAFGQSYSNFLNVLNTAKSRSISQDKPLSIAQCGAVGAVLNGYSVSIYTSGGNANKYSLNVVCSNTTIALSGYILRPLSSNGTITFGASSLTSVFFPVITGGAVLNNNGSLTTGTITLNGLGGLTKTINIDGKTGNIQ